MEEERREGFTVKDRRKVGREEPGETPKAAPGAAPHTEAPAGKPPEDAGKACRWQSPLPEISFSTLAISFSDSALMWLGDIPHPGTGATQVDLAAAKQAIDTLAMLQRKTAGNLEPEEQSFLAEVLYNLRMRFVQKSCE